VPYGSFQVENGVTWTARQRSNVVDGSEALLRLGVARCTEVLLTVPNYFYSTNGPASSGFANLGLAVKRQLPPLPGDFTLSATAGLAFPTGAKRISGPGYNPFVQFPWSRDIGYGWSVSGMFTVTWFPSQSQQNPTFQPTFAIGKELGPGASGVIEYVGEYNHQRPSQILDTGAVYRVTDHQEIDLQAGFGLNSSSLDHFFGLGYSFRLDGLF
jgi:Putative MetA-pathway of phenol degradation